MTGPTIVSPNPPAEEPAAARLRRAITAEMRSHDCPEPTDEQVSVVLHALADHTAILAAFDYQRGDGDAYPLDRKARSLGRWLHDTADQFQYIARQEQL